MNLSVITIARDNIKFIKGLLESTLPFLGKNDEWLIQDGGSTDGTWEYLKSIEDPRVKVCQEKQEFDYYNWGDHSIMQNRLVAETENDWYFSMDSDESFPKEFWENISSFINQKECIAYYFPTYHFYKSPKEYLNDDYHYPDLHIRLARKSKTWWVGDDHFSIWRKKDMPNNYYDITMFRPTDKDVKVLPYHLFHYARIYSNWRKRLDKEQENPSLSGFYGIHPRKEFNESNSNKST